MERAMTVDAPTVPARAASSRRAFTLIELLVVIAIVAILAAILFPVFAQAREKARQSSCLSNQKQLALAVLQYSQDFDETFPFHYYWGPLWGDTVGKGMNWWGSTLPYIKNFQVFTCPSDNTDEPPGWEWLTGQPMSYAANGLVAIDGNPQVARGPIIPIGSEDPTAWNGWAKPTALAEVSRPAESILIAEKHNGDLLRFQQQGSPNWDIANYTDFPDQVIMDSSADTSGSMGPRDACAIAPNGARPAAATGCLGRAGAMALKHAGLTNFAFCDGHVKAMKPDRTNPDGVNRPQDNLWDAKRQ